MNCRANWSGRNGRSVYWVLTTTHHTLQYFIYMSIVYKADVLNVVLFPSLQLHKVGVMTITEAMTKRRPRSHTNSFSSSSSSSSSTVQTADNNNINWKTLPLPINERREAFRLHVLTLIHYTREMVTASHHNKTASAQSHASGYSLFEKYACTILVIYSVLQLTHNTCIHTR